MDIFSSAPGGGRNLVMGSQQAKFKDLISTGLKAVSGILSMPIRPMEAWLCCTETLPETAVL